MSIYSHNCNLIPKITPITLKTIYRSSQLAPRVCTPEGKGRIFLKERSPSALTTQSRTHIGPECLDFSLISPFTSTAVLHPFPLTASISPSHHSPSTTITFSMWPLATMPAPLPVSASISAAAALHRLITAAVRCKPCSRVELEPLPSCITIHPLATTD